jgi:hypothetical protein
MVRNVCLGIALGISAFIAHRALGDDKPSDVRTPPAFDQFLVIPLRVHLLTATDLPEVNCTLRDEDVRRIMGKVNGIWNKAGVHWAVDGPIVEPAARQARFRLAKEVDRPGNLGLYRLLIPEASRTFEGLHVYYIHKFAVNGVWLGDDYAIVQDSAKLRDVEGGIDEPIPRVTAHELGHALGLPHRQDRTNLLASGTTGTLLNEKEVERVRVAARKIKGAMTAAELKDAAAGAEASGDRTKARRIWSWIAEIPGGDDEPRKALERLNGKAGKSAG